MFFAQWDQVILWKLVAFYFYLLKVSNYWKWIFTTFTSNIQQSGECRRFIMQINQWGSWRMLWARSVLVDLRIKHNKNPLWHTHKTSSFLIFLHITVRITHTGCPVMDQAVLYSFFFSVQKAKELDCQSLSLPKLTMCLLSNLCAKSLKKDCILSDMNQTSLNKIGLSEKAVKHAIEPGVNVLLTSHSFFRDAPQIAVWEHLTTKTPSW